MKCVKYAMSNCMCEECSLVTECWQILDSDFEIITDEKILDSVKNDYCFEDYLVDCDCSKCMCFDECCERM